MCTRERAQVIGKGHYAIYFHSFHFILNYLYRVKNIQFIREKNCFTMCPVKTEKKNKKKKLITQEIPNTT